MPSRRPALLAVLPLALLPVLASCSSDSGSAAESITVEASDTACTLSASSAPAGSVTFAVTNTGTEVTELYVYAADGTTIVAEVEDVTPGLSKDLAVTLPEGEYELACKPGEREPGIRTAFTATAA